MRAVLPGKPQAKLQALCTGQWKHDQIIVYISGNCLTVLTAPNVLLQTIYLDDGTELQAVAFDEESGKIATCSDDEVFIYKLRDYEGESLKWSLQSTLELDNNDDAILSLSWGSEEELLFSSNHLTLCATAEEPTKIWRKELANPAKTALFSPDASLIASTGFHDRLVKIWRRLSFGWNDVRFDFAYLPHPQTVVGVKWRRPFHREQTADNVLYTVCADNKLRIWAPTDPHGLQILQLWSIIDLQESINPRLFGSKETTSTRYTFIIDSRDFTLATERAVESNGDREHSQALEHIIEIAGRSPEVCVVLDDKGRMSAWGIENVGSKSKTPTSIFNIAHVQHKQLSMFIDRDGSRDNIQFHNFCGLRCGQHLSILIHRFDGEIQWMDAKVDELFAPSLSEHRWTRQCIWTGHLEPIEKIVRSASGKTIVSRTANDCAILWRQINSKSDIGLAFQNQLKSKEHIHRMVPLGDGSLVVLLHYKSITLWNAKAPAANAVLNQPYTIQGTPLCLVILPQTQKETAFAHIATISSEMKGIVWEIRLPEATAKSTNGVVNGSSGISKLREFCRFDLGFNDGLDFVLPVDPAGSSSMISGFVDTFARDVIVSYTKAGVIRSWTAKVDRANSQVDWLLTSTVDSGILNPSLASATSIRKTALVDSERTGLSIWDSAGQQLEFEESFSGQEIIHDLDWTSTPDQQSILAVGFYHKVVLMSQLRYDYLDSGSAWGALREIRLQDLTHHSIGDSVWLSNGSFAIGAGNQIFLYGKESDPRDGLVTDTKILKSHADATDLFGAATALNGTLPVFHPQFLGQLILSGKTKLVQRILLRLNDILKFYTEGDDIDSFLDMPLDEWYDEESSQKARARRTSSITSKTSITDDSQAEEMGEELSTSLVEKLTAVSIPQLSGPQQFHLADIVECAATAEKHRRSMDENAYRFLLFFRQHTIRRNQSSAAESLMTWRDFVWAFHSNSQEILIDLVSRQFQGRMSWDNARESGIFMWLRDPNALRNQMENIARTQYNSTEERNPVDCSLFYIALRKKNVLSGLWRMATWNREQVSTRNLLANDFRENKWKTTALKNAYALLGKHRFEYAAAFFLLADRLKDAVNVCANQLQDIQLAVAIARVYDGDESQVLKDLIEEKILPEAAKLGNRWLATWAFWMIGRRDMAVRSLISPVYTLLESPGSPDLRSKLFLANDPALIVMYKQLREKTLQTLKGASKISPKVEWEFVMHNARLYDRMGCDLLALDLVRNWEFLQIPSNSIKAGNIDPDPRSMLKRRGSLVVADLPSPQLSPAAQKKPPPSVFEEPSSSSLLDSFGF